MRTNPFHVAVEDIANIIHVVEKDEWPKVSGHPEGDCLGGDRCRFVALAIAEYLNGDREAPQCSCPTPRSVPALNCEVHGISQDDDVEPKHDCVMDNWYGCPACRAEGREDA